ncbi:MAG: hypothetical protein V3S14_06840 [Anaerolineae bacterium]
MQYTVVGFKYGEFRIGEGLVDYMHILDSAEFKSHDLDKVVAARAVMAEEGFEGNRPGAPLDITMLGFVPCPDGHWNYCGLVNDQGDVWCPRGSHWFAVEDTTTDAVCCSCGETYGEDKAKVKVWAESGRDFDPTDWECECCQRGWGWLFDRAEEVDCDFVDSYDNRTPF